MPDEELEKLYPKRITIVEVMLTDGSTMTERVEAVRGTSDNPMTCEEVTRKARDLMTPCLGSGNTAKLINAILNVERVSNVRELRPMLQRNGAYGTTPRPGQI